MITLDASIIVAALMSPPENASTADWAQHAVASRLWESVSNGHERVRQPVHWLSEVAAVLARLSPGSAVNDVRMLQALEWPEERALDVFPLAVELSIRLDHHVFDTLYHAVALISEGSFLTFDRKYFRKAASIGGVVIPG